MLYLTKLLMVFFLFAANPEYSLFFLVGAPGIYDSLYKLGLLKQLIEEKNKEIKQLTQCAYNLVHPAVSALSYVHTQNLLHCIEDKSSLIAYASVSLKGVLWSTSGST